MFITECGDPCFICSQGADIADYFNYGFTEETWKLYCEKQRKMKGEVMQLNKIVVSPSQSFYWASPLLWYSRSNNHLVRILVIRVLLFEVRSCDVLIFIDSITLDFFGMKCISFLIKNTLIIHVFGTLQIFNCSLRISVKF